MLSHGSVDPLIAALRRTDFSRLDRQNIAYLDYTGAAVYAERQVKSHRALLEDGLFGNPHAESDPSIASTSMIEEARQLVLRFVDADPAVYTVVFTANASAAAKVVAESYPFTTASALVLSADNHNSINGIREYARRAGAVVAYALLGEDLKLHDPCALLARAAATYRGPRLFAFPAQSNFSGVQHPLCLTTEAQRLGYDVLLDAAAFTPSNALSLHDASPEFVTLSFYKIFGYPTGVGALVVKKSVLHKLRRPWFAGGTVDFASVQNGIHQLKPSAEAFEDGTPDFLNIGALAAGFEFLETVGMDRVHEHVMRLVARLLDGLDGLRHTNGAPAIRLYGPWSNEGRGGTVAFNVLTRQGTALPYPVVERAARDAGVAIRGGCFCNPGAAEQAFGFDALRTSECLQRVAADFAIGRFAKCLGADTAVGAVRASLGLANNDSDVDRALDLVRDLLR
jgi:selenocysteine lyase/cysteine desulfurase